MRRLKQVVFQFLFAVKFLECATILLQLSTLYVSIEIRFYRFERQVQPQDTSYEKFNRIPNCDKT